MLNDGRGERRGIGGALLRVQRCQPREEHREETREKMITSWHRVDLRSVMHSNPDTAETVYGCACSGHERRITGRRRRFMKLIGATICLVAAATLGVAAQSV